MGVDANDKIKLSTDLTGLGVVNANNIVTTNVDCQSVQTTYLTTTGTIGGTSGDKAYLDHISTVNADTVTVSGLMASGSVNTGHVDASSLTCAGTIVGTISNSNLADSSVSIDKLDKKTISGVDLGESLAQLTAGSGISMAQAYNGSTAVTISASTASNATLTLQGGYYYTGTKTYDGSSAVSVPIPHHAFLAQSNTHLSVSYTDRLYGGSVIGQSL